MERLASPPPQHASGGCVVCGTALDSNRCGHCGAVARAGPYTIVRMMAQTAHGRVYLAEDDTGAKVALKELLYTLVPSVQELDAFERESRLLAELQHPRIPRFVRGFTEGRGVHTRLYLAQQFITGEEVAQRLEEKRFDEDEAFKLALQVLEILDWLHHRSPPLVHRDVKPANLILSASGDVHLVDFGTARDVAGAQTHRSTLVGTIGYMAPEQLGGTVGPKSDLYALGATLVHVLTGKSPELLAGPGAAIDVSKLLLSPQMTRFLRGLLALKPDDRFPDARAAIDAIFDPRRLSAAPAAALKPKAPLGLAMVAGGATMLLALGAMVLMAQTQKTTPVRSITVEPPMQIVPPPAPVVAAPALVEAESPPGDQPKIPVTAFKWELAKWDFSKPGAWVLDQTGHRHSVAFPRKGYSADFFGVVWDGSQKLLIADSPQLAVGGPFSLRANFGREKSGAEYAKLPKPSGVLPIEHLITRGNPNGKFAYDLSLTGETLRFTIADADGNRSTIAAAIEFKDVFSDYDAVFDSDTGEQSLIKLGRCEPLARVVTQVRPAKIVSDPHIHLIEGFVGRVSQLSIERGIVKITPSANGANCGTTSDKLGN